MVKLILIGGYVPGEGIVFYVKIDNRSNRDVKRISVTLIQQIKFYATKKSKIERRQVASFCFPKVVNKRSFEEWGDSVLAIPSVCPTSNGFCKIIDISYFILLSFDTSGPSLSADLNIPIIIGTTPLRVRSETPNSSDPPPYSYEASDFDSNSIRISNDDGNNGELVESDLGSYRPIYPFFKDYVFIP